MSKADFTHMLLGTDLRRLKNTRRVLDAVQDQDSFDELFSLTFHHERPLVMRAADCVEKITRAHPEYLGRHKDQILSVMHSADHKELKWHIAQLVSRVKLSKIERDQVWHTLTYWALNPNESRIVRVNALQGLFDLSRASADLQPEFAHTIETVSREPVPSIQARVRKLKRLMDLTPKRW